MKISWMNVVGALLVVVFACGYMYGDSVTKTLVVLPFIAGLVFVILGSRQRFQNIILKTSLVFLLVAGVVLSTGYMFGQNGLLALPDLIKRVMLAVIFFGIGGGLFLVSLGIVVWIFNEVKDFRANKV